VLKGLADLVLPPICLACDKLIASGDAVRFICRRCRTRLRPPPPPICQRCGAPRLLTGRVTETDSCGECAQWPAEVCFARSAFLMHPPADRIVHQLKYRGWRVLADAMAQPMADTLGRHEAARNIRIITAVPTTDSRLRERGYNQADLIARAVAAQSGRDCELLLRRTNSKSTQTTLQPAARGANVAGAFQLRENAAELIANSHVLLIDDVMTTGATALECARVLVAAGADTVSVLTYARAMDTRRLLAT
jgi:ComF family protein